MKKLYLNIFILFSSLFLNFNALATDNTLRPSLAPMLQKVLPAIVNIRASIKVTDFATLNRLRQEQGGELPKPSDNGLPPNPNAQPGPLPDRFLSEASGVILDANNGYILTNAHVVEDAVSILVTLSDGRHYTAKLIGIDPPSDVALLQINAKNLTAITTAQPNSLKVGDFVAAIGSPFGLNQTVTSGIVSALGRGTLGIENFENFIQTDAPINQGNSGGALLNSDGQLVGINTAILAPSKGSVGIGFAIPIDMAKSVMQQLIEYGNVKRGSLGIGAQDLTPELATAFNIDITKGAAVTQVMQNSPAELAGLKIGDIIIGINGSEVKNANDVVNGVAFVRVDSKIDISVLRNNKKLTLNATLLDPKKRLEAGAASDPYFYGVGLKEFSVLSPVVGNIKGILVVDVLEDSNAWHSDLRAGDVILTANQQSVTTIDDLKKIAGNSKQNLLLNVLRGNAALFLVVSKES